MVEEEEMNFRTIAIGFFIRDHFRKSMEIVAQQQQMLGRMSSVEIAHYMRSITPRRSGYMAGSVMAWNFQRRSLWGFEFFVGWRASQFPKAFYPVFVLYGTGIYGLYGKPIKPVSASRLAWQDKSGKWISKAETKGQREKPILKKVQQFGVKLLRQNIRFAHLYAMRTG